MSANFGSGGDNGQDFELNLASIIDCFTVLIAFMLVSASFLSVGVLDAGVSAAGQTDASTEAPDVSLTIQLKKDHKFLLQLEGKAQSNQTVSETELGEKLQGIKARFAKLDTATMVADDDIEYKDVVKAMETTRKVFPGVLLGGF